MIRLINGQETKVGAGTYAIRTTGACLLLWDIGDGEGFQLIEGADFGETTAKITLPSCAVKLDGAGANKLSLVLMHG